MAMKTPVPTDDAPAAPAYVKGEKLEEFARSYREVGKGFATLMGGFVAHARGQGWERATREQWVERLETFKRS